MQTITNYLREIHQKKPERAKKLARLICYFFRKPGSALLDQLINILGVEEVQQRVSIISADATVARKIKAFDQHNGLPVEHPFRVAVCLSGDMRSFANTRDSIERFFAGHQVDYFCHGWAGDVDESLVAGFPNLFWQADERPDLSGLEVKSIKRLGLKCEKNGLKRVRLSLYVFPMWFGIKSAYGLIRKSGKSPEDYDLICRCRYDNFMIGQLSQMPAIPADDVVVIDPNYNGYGAYADQFAIGRPSAMKQYFGLYDWLDEALDQYADADKVTAEILLKDWLSNQCALRVEQVDFGLRLLRKEFIGLAPHEIPLRSHTVSRSRNDVQSEYVKKTYPHLYERY